ncbi:MAG: GNAT family N-acetyltransferase, partial [Desulfofustis sp.]|nr:GNAT family N-acetyltransferase [Desulfofustis sp.]
MDKISLNFRSATPSDVSKIVHMLSDDPLGKMRERFEDPLPECYFAAFHSITEDPNNELVVATTGTEMAGFLQITFIPY